MTDNTLQQQIDFILEIDKLKNVIRRNYLSDDSRRENVAEHTWHSIMTAQLLFGYTKEWAQLDLLHIIKMIAVHDLVEIYAGDTFIFDETANQGKFERENRAAKELFGLLPGEQSEELYELWIEFENETTPDAIYACCIDKIMPVMLNTYSRGTSWREASISADDVFATLRVFEKAPETLRLLLRQLVDTALSKGNLQ